MDLKAWTKAELPAFLLALQFLTRVRLPIDVDYSAGAMRDSPRWYAAVGVVVGAVAGVIFWGAAALFSPALAALAAVATGVILTGGLHEDGFADACDGLGGDRPRERVLEIMRDSRIGTYGVLGLGLMLAAKVAALAALPGLAVPFVLIAGHAGSRASMLWVRATADYVRDQGAGSSVAGGVDHRAMVTTAMTVVVALVPLVFVLPLSALVVGVAGLVAGHYAMRQRFERRLGGYTGDCLGAVQQCSEIGFYLGVLLLAA